MGIMSTSRGKVLWIVALLVASLVVFGCAGTKPYEPRNNREEGPEKGLFTGSEGEFVIFRKAEEPETGSEDSKSSDETVDGEQQKTGIKEREQKEETKSGEQQP
jgi:hypothetical protein